MGIFLHTRIPLSMKVFESFFEKATGYLLKWCPLQDSLLINATWIGFNQRLNQTFSSVQFFISRFPSLLGDLNIDQFLSYQIMSEKDIPDTLKDEPEVDPAMLTSCGDT